MPNEQPLPSLYDSVGRLTVPLSTPVKWTGQAFNLVTDKLDGERMTLVKDRDGSVRALRRSHKPKQDFQYRFPKLKNQPWFKAFQQRAPKKTILDGELHVPGEPAAKLLTTCKKKPELVEYVVFACPTLWQPAARRPLHATSRAFAEAQYAEELGQKYVNFMRAPADVLQAEAVLFNYATKNKLEGVVVRDDPGYQYKYKVVRELDGVITNWKPGRDRNEGLVGSLNVSLYTDAGTWIEVASAGGMTMSERCRLTRMAKDKTLIGRVVEIRYDRVDAGGRLRFPRFVRLRSDKPKEECRWAQLNLG